MKRPSIAWAIVLSMVATLITTASTGAAAPAATPAAAAVQIDLNNPTAGITDPLAGVTPLARDCQPGQVDLNSASRAAISKGLSIPGGPTLDRILAGREYLRPIDAVSVPGVGPQKRKVLSEKFCAKATVLPPAPVNAPPAGFTGVDLQFASGDQIAALGVLNAETAKRLADYGPLPDNLHSIATPAVPGLSDPLIETLMARHDVAITPYPFVQDGVSWKWVSHDHGAVVTAPGDARYALIVPPSRVTGDGAWATVTPLPEEYGALPTADYHIYGDWTPWVATRLPIVYPGTPTQDLAVWHEAADGTRLSLSPSLASDSTTVTAPARSLSPRTSTYSPLAEATCTKSGTILCLKDDPLYTTLGGTQDFLVNDMILRLRAYQLSYLPQAPGPCPEGSSPRITVRGESYASCTLSESGKTVTATLVNESPVDALAYGTLMEASTSGGQFQPAGYKDFPGITTALLFNSLANLWPGLWFPGQKITNIFSEGDPQSSLTAGSAYSEAAITAWTMAQGTSLVDGLLASELSGRIGECMPSKWPPDVKAFNDCIRQVAESVGTSKLSLLDPLKQPAKSLASRLKAAAKFLIAVDSVISILTWVAQSNPKTMTFLYLNPPPPVSTGTAGSLSLSRDGRFIAMDGHRAFLVMPGRPPLLDLTTKAHEITTNDGFNCYAEGYLVIDQVEAYTGTDGRDYLRLDGDPVIAKGEPAPPCERGGPSWDYKSPVTMSGNTPTGIVLKEPDWQGIRTWWVTADGTIQRIADGGTYLCLAAKHPVLWNFGKRFAEEWVQPVTDPVTEQVKDGVGPTASCP